MSKKLNFPKKPSSSVGATDANTSALDAFVGVETPKPVTTEKMKRFTIDVSPALHRRVKTQCAAKGVDMADEIRRLLEENFPEKS